MNASAPDDRIFFEIALGTGDPCACTPEIEDDVEGLRIAAPQRVPIGEEMTFPLCVVVQMTDTLRDALPEPLWDEFLAVAVDSVNNRVYAERLGDPSPVPAETIFPTPPPDPDAFPIDPDMVIDAEEEPGLEIVGVPVRSYRNLDLLSTLDLPREPAVYHVFLTWSVYQSNTVRVAFVHPDAARE